VSDVRHVRVKVGSESVRCIVCGAETPHDLVVSGVPGTLRRHTPRTDLRHYSLCLHCGTKNPRSSG